MTVWLTVREAADYARISEPLIRDAVKLGYLPAYAVGESGTSFRLRAEGIDEWMMSPATSDRSIDRIPPLDGLMTLEAATSTAPDTP
jgi:excisionase family DNA binding protein